MRINFIYYYYRCNFFFPGIFFYVYEDFYSINHKGVYLSATEMKSFRRQYNMLYNVKGRVSPAIRFDATRSLVTGNPSSSNGNN